METALHNWSRPQIYFTDSVSFVDASMYFAMFLMHLLIFVEQFRDLFFRFAGYCRISLRREPIARDFLIVRMLVDEQHVNCFRMEHGFLAMPLEKRVIRRSDIIRNAAVAQSYIFQLLCVLCCLAEDAEISLRRAPKNRVNCFRKSRGFLACQGQAVCHIVALLIRYLTCKLFAVDFHPGKKFGTRKFIDRATGVVIAEKLVVSTSSLSPSTLQVVHKHAVKLNNNSRIWPDWWQGLDPVFLLRAGVKTKNSRKRPDTLRQEFELVKLLDKLVAKLWGRISARPDHNMSGKMHSGKHGRNDGLTAFRSQVQGREQSPLDGGTEQHIVQVDYQNQDSANATASNSGELASQAFYNASSASDNSLKVSDPPEDRDGDKSPPPYRLRPDKVTSSQAPVQVISFASLANICLIASAQVGLAGSVIRFNTGTALSANAKILLFRAELFGFAGFLSCLVAYIVQHSRRASLLTTVIGCAATGCGLLSILGTQLPENLMLWLTDDLCMLAISALLIASMIVFPRSCVA